MKQNSDEFFLQKAVQTARIGIRNGQTPFGAAIVRKNKVIARSHNELWKRKDCTAHAEIIALRQACRKLKTIDLSACTIFSTCEPCPMCFSAIHWSGIKRIVFGTGIADAKKAGFNELLISNRQLKKIGKSKMKIKGGVLLEDCRQLFLDWKKLKKSEPY